VYGDGIYPILSNVLSRTAPDGMTHVRIANEWTYGVTANLFPYIKFSPALKILKHKHISHYYKVGTIFRNLHAILYGGLVSSYFNMNEIDMGVTLSEYLDLRHRPF
jgi:hypothetical protein